MGASRRFAVRPALGAGTGPNPLGSVGAGLVHWTTGLSTPRYSSQLPPMFLARTNTLGASVNVLHVITGVARGGAEGHLVELARGQVAGGANVTVAYLKGDCGYWTDVLKDAGVGVEALGLRWYGDPSPLLRLRTMIKRLGPDILHAHLPPAELYARLALVGEDAAPRFVITRHNDEPFYRGAAHRSIARWVVKRADRVIAISEAVSRQTCAYLGVPHSRVRTIHYGINSTLYDQIDRGEVDRLRRMWDVPEGAILIGTVGRMAPQKAMHVMLRGFARYRRETSGDPRLVLVGAGPLERKLKRLAQKLGLGNGVIWAGFREDIPVVMQAFDVFALTSDYEGFGLVLLEAMAAGKPVVATRVSAIPEIVVEGETGLLCDAGDDHAVADAFFALEDEVFRKRLGSAGFSRAAQRFKVEAMVNATEALYREVLGEGC